MNAFSYINSRISKPIPVGILILISLGYVFTYIFLSPKISALLLALTVVIPILVIIIIKPDFGFLFSFIYSAFFFPLSKHVVPRISDIPHGVVFDSLLCFILFAYIIKQRYISV